jgi:hypothetical protein
MTTAADRRRQLAGQLQTRAQHGALWYRCQRGRPHRTAVQSTDVEEFPVRQGGDGRETAVGRDHDPPVEVAATSRSSPAGSADASWPGRNGSGIGARYHQAVLKRAQACGVQMAGYEPRIGATVSQLLDRAETAGEFDLVTALAAPLPVAVITDLLGIPERDRETFARYGTVVAGALDGIRSLSHASRLQKADTELTALFTDLFARRRHEPADDIVSRLVCRCAYCCSSPASKRLST